MANLRNSISDRLEMNIANGHTSQTMLVALATGMFDVNGVNIDFTHTVAHTHHHNLADLKAAGYKPDVIFDDNGDLSTSSPYGPTSAISVTKGGDTANVTMTTASGKTVASMKQELANNPRNIKRITITARDSSGKEMPSAFDGNMFVASANPFNQENLKAVALNQYFATTQYQSGKITIDYPNTEAGLQWNDMLLWMIEVPAGCRMAIAVDFYPAE